MESRKTKENALDFYFSRTLSPVENIENDSNESDHKNIVNYTPAKRPHSKNELMVDANNSMISSPAFSEQRANAR